jgi:hypothetical protein
MRIPATRPDIAIIQGLSATCCRVLSAVCGCRRRPEQPAADVIRHGAQTLAADRLAARRY